MDQATDVISPISSEELRSHQPGQPPLTPPEPSLAPLLNASEPENCGIQPEAMTLQILTSDIQRLASPSETIAASTPSGQEQTLVNTSPSESALGKVLTTEEIDEDLVEDTGDSPFAFTAENLTKLHQPKSLSLLRAMGGGFGLAKGLGSHLERGLSWDETTCARKVTIADIRHEIESRRRAAAVPIPDEDEGPEQPPFSPTRSFSIARVLTRHHATPFEDRRRIYSENRIPASPPKGLLQLMWAGLKDKILIILMITAVVSLALGFYQSFRPGATNKVEWVEGVAILIAVFVIDLVQAVNDYDQERKFITLNQKVVFLFCTNWQKQDRNVKVIRNGRTWLISDHDVLVGDILRIEAGDVVSVDGVLVENYNVRCDESVATGESNAMRKVTADIALENVSSRVNFDPNFDPFILSGSKILEGVGRFIVTAVGPHSYYGQTLKGTLFKFFANAAALEAEPEKTPLQAKLEKLAQRLIVLGSIVAGLLFIALFIKFLVSLPGSQLDASGKGQQFVQVLITALIILVIAVPEGLPLAVTLALAYATIKMLKDQNLVRSLRACETVGNATTICTDKTGTLTQNKTAVVVGTLGGDDFGNKTVPIPKFFSSLSPGVADLIRQSIVLNSTAFEQPNNRGVFIGSRLESALLELSQKYLGLDDLATERTNVPVLQFFPFNSERKSMGVIIQLDQTQRLLVKGASEIVLSRCDRILLTSTIQPLSNEDRISINQTIQEYAGQALRTIAFAYCDRLFNESDIEFEDIFSGMIWIGVFGLKDPLRPGVVNAVRDCIHAGVFVRMVTGDNIATAKAIAAECGIWTPGGIVMEGEEFRTLSPEQMTEKIPRLQVLARSSPTDKRILVNYLKKLGEIVAVTGDGTNDGPALRAADVGFSMGIAGTEVAKEASSIILMDDDFASIVKAILWGRCVNDAVRKFLQFQLTVTIGAVVIAFVTSLAATDGQSVLAAVPLLWINLIQDTFAALALATDPPTLDLLDRKPESRNSPVLNVNMWKMIVGQSALQIIIILVLNFAGQRIFTSWTDLELKTVIFNTFAWLQISNQTNCRRIDDKLNVFYGIHRNWLFIAITLLTIGAQIIIIFFGGEAFSVTSLSGVEWAVSLVLGLLSLPLGALIRKIPNKWILEWVPKRRNRERVDEEDGEFVHGTVELADN